MILKHLKNLHFVKIIVVFLANEYLLSTFARNIKNKEYLIKVII
jgi:hypothetical protein